MRAGGCTVQQSLTVEAANVVKQALVLAQRRGHAQVTPLHVANTMLSTSNGLLRTACLQSHSHPLQCKALELCFNVALNRLPASSSGPMLGPHSSQQHPTISNALVAAFKRAQAHQRRGSIENQQQPLLAVKIELEQLIISILDDPSVSRVMREAGFSSTQVKSNVEQAVSKESSANNNNDIVLSKPSPNGGGFMKESKPSTTTTTTDPVKDEDVGLVLESLMNRRRKSVVIVGECLSSLEGVIGGMMDRIEKGKVDEGLREVKMIRVGLNTFGNLQREEVEQKVGELTCLVRSLVGNGVILYLGDLKWIVDYRANSSNTSNDKQGRFSYYCAVEHMIMELGRLIYGMGENNGRIWLMGLATFQTYMRCRSGQNSLEALWGLHPITLPAGGLDLSLNTESTTNGSEIESGSKIAESSLPSWLKEESKRLKNNENLPAPLMEDQLISQQQKWSSSSVRKNTISLERNLTLSSSSSPSSSTSFFSYDHQHYNNNLMRDHPKQAIDHSPPTTSTPNSASSSDVMEMEYISRFKEFNAENLNIICNALEQKVPWQKGVIPDIAGTILQCRSGMLKRKEKVSINGVDHDQVKEETWLFFQGLDVQAKEKIARELAKVVFGSYSNFVTIALSSFSSTRADSTDHHHHQDDHSLIRRSSSFKRLRDEQSGGSYVGRLAQEMASNPHRVFMVEDVEQADFHSQMGIKRAIERGKISNNESSGEEVSLCDAIIILSCESFSSRSRACSPTTKPKLNENVENSPFLSLDLNISINDERVEEEDEEEDHQSIDDIGILENVDGRIVFKMHELSALVR